MKTINQDQVEEEVRDIIAEILEVEPDEIKPNDRFVEDLDMDSMMALEILASIEKKYKIAITEDSLPKFTSLATTLEIVFDILKKG